MSASLNSYIYLGTKLCTVKSRNSWYCELSSLIFGSFCPVIEQVSHMPDIASIQTAHSGPAPFDILTVDLNKADEAAFLVDEIGFTLTINYDPTRDTQLSNIGSEHSGQSTENELADPNPQHVVTLIYDPDDNGGEKFLRAKSPLPVQKRCQAVAKAKFQAEHNGNMGIENRLNLAYAAMNEQNAISTA